jgi:NSS family neurotransmitter:Na+ symporter
LNTESSAPSKTRELFGSRAGFVMAAVGSAVGPGNMWRFSYRTAEGGGAAFVLLYLGMTLLIGVPMMMAEFGMGRRTRLSSVGALRTLGGPAWVALGYLFVLTSLVIVAYLSVITGWTVRYAFDGVLTGYSATPGARYAEVSVGSTAMLYHIVIMGVTTGIVILGVKKGIARASLLLMPILFLILIALALWAATLEGAGPGYAFYLTPSVAALMDPLVIQGAASQAFFSLSVGMGIMLTYGSYLSGSENLGREALIVSMADFSVAFIAGLVVFPVIFALGLSGDMTESTMGTLFISLPGAFREMGLMGRVVGVSFFLALAVASITSTVSLLEVVAAVGIDEFKLTRRAAALIAGVLAAGIGVFAALSGDVLGVLDKIAGEFFVVVGVLGTSLFFGWRVAEPIKHLAEGASPSIARALPALVFVIRYLIPPILAFMVWVAFQDMVATLAG